MKHCLVVIGFVLLVLLFLVRLGLSYFYDEGDEDGKQAEA